MKINEFEAAFTAALHEAGIKASPEETWLAVHVFASEIEARSAYRRANRKATAAAVAAVAAVAGIMYLVF